MLNARRISRAVIEARYSVRGIVADNPLETSTSRGRSGLLHTSAFSATETFVDPVFHNLIAIPLPIVSHARRFTGSRG